MLPKYLYSSYKQYKSDTNTIGNWLVTTAKNYGYQLDHLLNPRSIEEETQVESPRRPRLKGKARKAAKEQKPIDSVDDEKHPLSTKDFVPLADYIAKKSKGILDLSLDFADRLDRAINLRREHAAHYHSSLEKKTTNQSHCFFISILEDVRNILTPVMASCYKKARADSNLEKCGRIDGASISNLFVHLEVEEPSDSYLNMPPVTPKASNKIEDLPPPTDEDYEVEIFEDGLETELAAFCFIQDLNKFRRFIKETWTLHFDHKLSLEAAAVATNTALDLVGHLHREFQHAYPKCSAVDFVTVYYESQCCVENEDPHFLYDSEHPFNIDTYQIANDAFLTPCVILQKLSDLLRPGKALVAKLEPYDHNYDPTDDRAGKCGCHKFQEDTAIINQVLADFHVIGTTPLSAGTGFDGEDEISRLFSLFMNDRAITFPVLVAVQSFIDIHHIFRSSIHRPLLDLRRNGQYILDTSFDTLVFHKNLRDPRWPPKNDEQLRVFLDNVSNTINGDFIADYRRDIPGAAATKRRNLLYHHPLLCGSLSFAFKVRFRNIALKFVNVWGSIMYAAHVYNAVYQENLISKTTRWTDIDLLYGLHAPSEFFVGAMPMPDSMEAYFKSFCLQQGASATNFAANPRHLKKMTKMKMLPNSRELSQNAIVSNLFSERYCKLEGSFLRYDIEPSDVETILKKCGDDHFIRAIEWDAVEKGGNDRPAVLSLTRRRTQKKSNMLQNWQKSHTLTPIDLLLALRKSIHEEEVELAFDYFRMHRVCWQFLRDLCKKVDPDLQALFGTNYMSSERHLAYVPYYIFLMSLGEQGANEIMRKTKMKVPTLGLLNKAAMVVRDVIASGKGAIVQKIMLDEAGVGAKPGMYKTAATSCCMGRHCQGCEE